MTENPIEELELGLKIKRALGGRNSLRSTVSKLVLL